MKYVAGTGKELTSGGIGAQAAFGMGQAAGALRRDSKLRPHRNGTIIEGAHHVLADGGFVQHLYRHDRTAPRTRAGRASRHTMMG